MSERERGWGAAGFVVDYTAPRDAFEGAIHVRIVGNFLEQIEQAKRLAAWLNHIAPDGVIPVVPNDRESASE